MFDNLTTAQIHALEEEMEKQVKNKPQNVIARGVHFDFYKTMLDCLGDGDFTDEDRSEMEKAIKEFFTFELDRYLLGMHVYPEMVEFARDYTVINVWQLGSDRKSHKDKMMSFSLCGDCVVITASGVPGLCVMY